MTLRNYKDFPVSEFINNKMEKEKKLQKGAKCNLFLGTILIGRTFTLKKSFKISKKLGFFVVISLENKSGNMQLFSIKKQIN